MKKNYLKIIMLIVIDQLLKILAISTIGKTGESITVIPNILNLTYLENYGAAFGLVMTRIMLIGVDLLIIFAIIKIMTSKKYEFDEISNLGFSLVLAGGIGNLIDRIFRGYVVDYIDVTEFINFPIFNFADICIVVGIILIIIRLIINTIKIQENVNEGV